jgi:tRNA 2-selenouridine synthase
LICWRGGLRSKIASEWLLEVGVTGLRVEGGYKALRRELSASFQRLPELVVLGGLTGAGKTLLLRELPAAGILDLEGLAVHRGSSFGDWIRSGQPAQQTFENAMAMRLFEGASVMAVEAESRMVGRCYLPAELKNAMDGSEMVLLEAPMDQRVSRIFQEYVADPLREYTEKEVFEHLHAALERIHRRLGGLRFQTVAGELEQAFSGGRRDLESHAAWIEFLLREYYDPLYEHSLKRDGRAIAFRGDYGSVKNYLADRLNRRRT